MSRAFVKEDVELPEPIAERPVGAAPNRVTARGLGLIDEQIAQLERQLPPPAAGGGIESRELQLIRRDLRYWTARRASARFEPAPAAPTTVGFATIAVIARDGTDKRLEIVGEDEADPAAGRIAWTSPLGRALDGAEPGDTIDFIAAGRVQRIALLAVEPLA